MFLQNCKFLRLSCFVKSEARDERTDRGTIRYDTIPNKSLTWTKKLSDQLNLAHVAEKMKKKKLKQTNASAHLIQYRFKIYEGSPEGIRMTMEEKICERDEF